MGALICCCWRMWCCDCACFEKKDLWKIDEECRPGEKAAGYLYKRAKSSAMWSKRYFVIVNDKLVYYVERDRGAMKGEIVLAGARAEISHTRADTKKKFYFTISHPQCGARELCAKTRARREQWIAKVNDISQNLVGRSGFGKLLKQGGLSKNVWQERWCVCAGVSIDYFDQATDNQSKGSINIVNATVNPIKIKEKFCFELSAAQPGKKGNKKYVFAAEKEHDRDQWVEMLRKLSTMKVEHVDLEALNSQAAAAAANQNPLHSNSNNNDDDEDGGSNNAMMDEDTNQPISRANSNASTASTASVAKGVEMSGYLMKKSPAMLKGWQKRYFKTLSNGDIVYFKDEKEAANPSSEPKGVIHLGDIANDGIELDENKSEFTIKLQDKKVQLKASNGDEAADWARNILAWVQSKRS